jgi:hypothetical protein
MHSRAEAQAVLEIAKDRTRKAQLFAAARHGQKIVNSRGTFACAAPFQSNLH